MKRIMKRMVALLLVLMMVFILSGCASANDGTVAGKMIDFWLNGWDGIFTEKARAVYVAPNPRVRSHAIRENHRATQRHAVGTTSNYSGSYGTGVASTDGPAD
ncbi:MAG: hypothetical protein II742_04020 [Clostridia bacterium]|nr:hypothetical protein [Clostridia bacterium]